ncbi:SH2 domain protein B [Zea mays]|uniref:tRNA (guanine(46)-N(7))-methyltransferase n=2 Tax=Zea mays TaxID=4577 RepID=A0A1D6JP89_MAIZE|nr:SH2 domain protein B [Zea mays]
MAWTTAATVCWRLLHLPSARCPLSSRARCSAAQSPDAVDKEYADLNLRPLYPNVCRHPSSLRPYPGAIPILPLIHLCTQRGHHMRIRQHVNPLSSSFSEPTGPPEWKEVFDDPLLPLMVDIGCGAQGILMSREWEVLDLAREEFWQESELPWARNPPKESHAIILLSKTFALLFGTILEDDSVSFFPELVERAQFWVNELELMNVYFMFANATVSFEKIISSYPGPLSLVSILCPDPHFKKRHHKRRVLQQPLVDSIINNLCLGGQVFIQSDVLEVSVDMRERFDGYSGILAHVNYVDQDLQCDNEGWLLDNPMGIRTEREIHAELEGATIYRRVYQKVRDASF